MAVVAAVVAYSARMPRLTLPALASPAFAAAAIAASIVASAPAGPPEQGREGEAVVVPPSVLLEGDPFRQLEEMLPTANDFRAASGAPGARYWQQQVDQDIEVALDP